MTDNEMLRSRVGSYMWIIDRVQTEPGYDGVYGKVSLFTEEELRQA